MLTFVEFAGLFSNETVCGSPDLRGLDLGKVPLLAIVVLSLVLPIGIFLGIANLRVGRGALLKELDGVFSVKTGTGQEPVVHSFDMLKRQYESGTGPFDGFGAFVQYVIPVSLFVVLCWIGFDASLSPWIVDCAGIALSPLVNPTGTLIGSLSYTFFGAYLWSVGHLIRRVSNNDLSPISFFQAVFHLLLATFVSAAIWHAHLFGEAGADFLVVVAFLIGWFPDLFLGQLIAKFPWLALKRIGPETLQLREELPLDTILGIDPYIKLRLNEYEIMDVQNLATANPIKIFVETPYDLIEAIDWVAQAQLILAVGSANTVALRRHNIRTIFDLEKGVRNPAIGARLLAILRAPNADATPAPRAPPRAPPGAPPGAKQKPASNTERLDSYGVATEIPLDLDDEVSAIVAFIRDDLHVRRLRQIWDIVNSRLNQRV